jgi:hypothetical protein
MRGDFVHAGVPSTLPTFNMQQVGNDEIHSGYALQLTPLLHGKIPLSRSHILM